MVCMAMALCVSCKKDNAEPSGGNTGGGNTGGGGGGTGSHEYVDLGLPSGLLWATCNVGADSPDDYGDYFAWGETETKSDYDWDTYKWCNGSKNTLTKYCTKSSYGTVDNRTVLEMSDDAARANWGGDWRMPTTDDWQELYDNCTWTWMSDGDVGGYRVTGSNGHSLFLPAAGNRNGTSLYGAGSFGIYWSSSLNTVSPYYAYYLYFYSGNVSPQSHLNRFNGFTVRPVQ